MRCPFCLPDNAIAITEFALVFRDRYPVTEGHTLVCPRRHVADYFELDSAEKDALWRTVDQVKLGLEEEFGVRDFNVGLNVGEFAGQTVMHAHIHVIPRRRGDHPEPRGGIRAVIEGKKDY